MVEKTGKEYEVFKRFKENSILHEKSYLKQPKILFVRDKWRV